MKKSYIHQSSNFYDEVEDKALLTSASLAYQGIYIGSESSFYRHEHARGQLHRRADGPSQVWSLDISYLPNFVKGIWFNLYLVVVTWSRKVVAWDV